MTRRVLAWVGLWGTAILWAQVTATPPEITPQIVRVMPHTGSEFTQGLFIHQNLLYEGTGLYGKSAINVFDLRTGERLGRVPLDTYFGEGISIIQDRLVQLTWRAGKAIVYEFPNLKPIGSQKYVGEGWGLTSDDKQFIMSNGSDTLFFRDTDFRITAKLPVTLAGNKLSRLNELEKVGRYVYANVFLSHLIVEIDLSTGMVSRVINCSNLLAVEKPSTQNHVLNGIAFDKISQTFYLTGKNWNNLFEVVIPLPDP